MSSPLSISIFGPSSSPVLSHPVPKASSLIPFSPFATDRLSVPEAVTERFHPTSLWYYYIRALMRVLLLFHIPSLSSSSPFRYIEGPPPRLSRLSADFRPPSLRLAAGGDPKPLSRLPPPPSSLHLSIFRPFYHLLPLSASLSQKSRWEDKGSSSGRFGCAIFFLPSLRERLFAYLRRTFVRTPMPH